MNNPTVGLHLTEKVKKKKIPFHNFFFQRSTSPYPKSLGSKGESCLQNPHCVSRSESARKSRIMEKKGKLADGETSGNVIIVRYTWSTDAANGLLSPPPSRLPNASKCICIKTRGRKKILPFLSRNFKKIFPLSLSLCTSRVLFPKPKRTLARLEIKRKKKKHECELITPARYSSVGS